MLLTERAWERVRDPSGQVGKGPGNIPAKKVETVARGGTALGFAIFPT